MAKLTIRLLGRPRIEINGEPLSVDTRKAIALLVYLAVTRQAHRRSALSVLLWPDSDQERGRTALRRTLATLNKALGAGWLVADRKIIGIDWEKEGMADALWMDFEELRRLVAKAEAVEDCEEKRPYLQKAADLYEGPFLEGFSLNDSAAFDDWQFFEGEQLNQEMIGVWRTLIPCLAEVGEYDDAITYARQWLGVDNLHEEAHQQLMQLFAWAGQRNAALRQYEECVRILDEEIGVEPQEETTAVYDQIHNNTLPAPATIPEPEPEPTPTPPPTPSYSRPRHNLPRIGTPFVGRGRELEEINGRLNDPNCRLLTIIGSGGAGKSRLALETGKSRLTQYRHGVYFVPLTEIDNPDNFCALVADSIHFSFFGRRQLHQQLIDYLYDKEMLLILDNFEHLLEAADMVADAVQSAPNVQFLITTQERLNVREEWLYELEAFACPEDDSIEESFAYQLFRDRARQIQPDFSPTEADQKAIAQICRFVGGLALGIELAASWVRILSCEEIVAQMTQSLDFLTTSLRNIPERHRSLRAVFEYSWRLLTDREQETFARLAVFRGGIQIPAALQITQISLPSLLTLTDKSLLRLGADGRHTIPAVLRQYANDKFRAEPEREAIERRFAAYFLNFVANQEADLKGKQQIAALRHIRAEIENVRTAWRHGVQYRLDDALLAALPTLLLFYETRSWLEEGARLFGDGVEVVKDGRLCHALQLAQGACYARLARFDDAEALLRHGLEGMRALEDRQWLGMGLYNLGIVVQANGRHDEALTHLQESLTLYQSIEERWGTANVFNALGNITFSNREYDAARHHYEESLQMRRKIGDQRGIAVCFHNMGNVPLVVGEYDEAKSLYEESLSLHRELKDVRGAGHALNNIGYVCVLQESYAEAMRVLDESLIAFEQVGDQQGLAHVLQNFGHIAFGQGRLDEAQARFEESRALFQTMGNPVGMADVLVDLGRVALAQGNVDEAKRHGRISLEMVQPIGVSMMLLQGVALFAEVKAHEEAWETAVAYAQLVIDHPDTQFATRTRLRQLIDKWPQPEKTETLTLDEVITALL